MIKGRRRWLFVMMQTAEDWNLENVMNGDDGLSQLFRNPENDPFENVFRLVFDIVRGIVGLLASLV
jgi:hypothetical protein